MSVLISCEVGGARVPVQWPALRVSGRDGSVKRRGRSQSGGRVSGGSKQSVQKESEIVADTTAMYVAERMAKCLGAPLIANEYSNQVIDVRRSLRHRQLFSKPTRGLPAEDRQRLIDTIHTPYRDRLRTKFTANAVTISVCDPFIGGIFSVEKFVRQSEEVIPCRHGIVV